MKLRPSSSVTSFRLTATDSVTSCAHAPAAASSTTATVTARVLMNRISRLLSSRSTAMQWMCRPVTTRPSRSEGAFLPGGRTMLRSARRHFNLLTRA